MSKVAGINLGTVSNCVSTTDGGRCKAITSLEGSRTTPSVAAYKNGERIVDDAVRRQVVTNKNTISSVKRPMDTDEEVKLEGKQCTPQEVSTTILQYLKSYAEDCFGEKIEEAVITVPVYSNDSQHQAAKGIGKVASLEIECIINEPTAVVLAYGTDRIEERQEVLVYDLGGGAFDVSIPELADGILEVPSISNDTKLDGDDFDNVIVDWMIDTLKKESGVDPYKDAMATQHLKETGEETERGLSRAVQAQISPPPISVRTNGPLRFEVTLTRVEFDEIIKPLVEHTIEPIRDVLRGVDLTKNDIHQVLLIGGSIHIPVIQGVVKGVLGEKPNRSVNPDEVVVTGTVVRDSVIVGDIKGVLLLDVTLLNLGIEAMNGVMTVLIPRNTAIPTNKSQVLSTAVNNQPAVDIHALQGERSMANDNKELDTFKLDSIAPARRSVSQIEAAFDINVSGIVHVSAKDKGTDREQSITIRSTGGPNDEEIDRVAREAKEHKAENEKCKEEIGLCNCAKGFIAQIDSMLTDSGDKIGAKRKEETQKLHDDLQKSLDENGIDTVKEKLEALEKAAQAASAQVCQQQSADPNAGANTNNANNDDNVADAEFEEKR